MKFPGAIIFPVLLGLAAVGGSPAAWAQEYYFDLHVGYNLVEDGNIDYPPTFSTSYEQRPAFGGSFGYLDGSGIRLEGELTWRGNDVDRVAGANDAGRLTGLSLMVNALYELRIGAGGGGYGLGSGSPLRPYIGIGGGGTRYKLEVIPSLGAPPQIDDQAYALAYQGIIGVGIEITETSLITLDFRYFVADNIEMEDAGAVPFEIDLVQSSVMFGLRTVF